MRIEKIGEFGLIERIAKKAGKGRALVGIGDDTAVLKYGGKLLLWTVDTLVEGDHFSLEWFSPRQVGMKAIEINASDIYAMGGIPKQALVALVLPHGTRVELVDGTYEGMLSAAKKHGIEIVGGNITHGRQLAIDVTMLGTAEKKKLSLRSGAKPNDLICVSGPLGDSRAGLIVFLRGKRGFKKLRKKYLEPKAKPEKAKKLAGKVNAMIDVSDGLASEVRNICTQSKCGAVLHHEKIPVSREAKKLAARIGTDAARFALFGGEDFELVFSVPEKKFRKEMGVPVGKITKGRKIFLEKKGVRLPLEKFGYDHFKENIEKVTNLRFDSGFGQALSGGRTASIAGLPPAG